MSVTVTVNLINGGNEADFTGEPWRFGAPQYLSLVVDFEVSGSETTSATRVLLTSTLQRQSSTKSTIVLKILNYELN
jgi:hypothetical protein